MTARSLAASLVLASAIFGTVACEKEKSANPLSPDVAGPIPGVSISAPKPLDPPIGAQVVAAAQPPTLLIENGSSSGERTLWLQLEIASDVAFQRLVHHNDRVTPGPDGRTLYKLPDPLAVGTTYYWRARALDGANVGPYSAVANFSVIEAVAIEAPTPLEPAGNITTNRPEFKAKNGRVTGAAGDVIYRFEIATAPDPASIVAVISSAPNGSGTTTVSLGDLPYDRTFYWRVWATNGSTQSAYSTVVSFKTPAPPAPPPPPPPPPPTPTPTPTRRQRRRRRPTPTPTPTPTPAPGTGTRTPDPAPGQRLPLPSYGASVVQQVAAARPDLLRNSCQPEGGTWGFMDAVVDTLRQRDTRWGYNWKRGNVGDPSNDVIDYHFGAGRDEGSTEVYLIDIIGSHCTPGASAGWTDVTAATAAGGAIGRWTGRGRF